MRCCVAAVMMMPVFAAGVRAEEAKWIELTGGDKPFEAFQGPTGDWTTAESVELDPKKANALAYKPGSGLIVNGPKGNARNLVTKQKFADAEVHVEFLIPKRSNSGVKLMGVYEIQIVDSHGRTELTGDSAGGIYPRAEDKPKYHHIDKGTAPKVNAAKPAGEWQTLDIVFTAPRFGADGKKTANAKFVKVTLNGQVVHENVELECPTGSNWRLAKETPTGPLLLQADHGPVAFRNVKIRPMEK